jgi:NAD(P)-dependent dehydrogenase (short-subunit alcohol dehydrogenase family)
MADILLTGASSGVGEHLAQSLCAERHRVCGIARNTDKLQSLRSTIGEKFLPVPGDLAETDTLANMAAHVIAELGNAPDIIIHNAGSFVMADFSDHTPTDIERLWRVNTLAPMLLTHALLPAMLSKSNTHSAHPAQKIICIASVAGTHGLPQQTAYCASKHGLVGFADALSCELRGSGVTVHTICPGGIDTPLWRSGRATYPGNVDATMQPSEIAELVSFLIKQPSNTRYRRIICFPDIEWH